MRTLDIKSSYTDNGFEDMSEEEWLEFKKAVETAERLIEEQGYIGETKYRISVGHTVAELTYEALEEKPDIQCKPLFIKVVADLQDKIPMHHLSDSFDNIWENRRRFFTENKKNNGKHFLLNGANAFFEKNNNGKILSKTNELNIAQITNKILLNEPDIRAKAFLLKTLSNFPDDLSLIKLTNIFKYIKQEWESFKTAQKKAA